MSPWAIKGEVIYVQAPSLILEQILAVRVQLDDV